MFTDHTVLQSPQGEDETKELIPPLKAQALKVAGVLRWLLYQNGPLRTHLRAQEEELRSEGHPNANVIQYSLCL